MVGGILRTKKAFTLCRPIPGFIPRQLAVDILHDHREVITLNPLVIDHKPIKAPQSAANDEFYATWYEIIERIQYIPGIGQMGSGKISFNGCFHNMPWGLQTHIYAPMSVDLRAQYRVAGNQPGVEPPAPRELGLTELGAPTEGLYLRVDIEFSSNVAFAKFVRAQLEAAIKEMVDRMVKRAEVLDADVLQSMLTGGSTSSTNAADPVPAATGTHLQSFAPMYTQPHSPSYTQPYNQYAQPHPMAMAHHGTRTNEPPGPVELPGVYPN